MLNAERATMYIIELLRYATEILGYICFSLRAYLFLSGVPSVFFRPPGATYTV